jgi:hypothetical protein
LANVFQAALSSFNSTIEALQKAIETRDAIKFSEIKVGLLAQIQVAYNAAAAVQQREAELREENESLKRRIVEFESEEARKARYELKRLHPGITICELKAGMDAARDPQQACYTCYERGKIRALHSDGVIRGVEKLHCGECGAVLRAGTYEAPQGPPRRPWRG